MKPTVKEKLKHIPRDAGVYQFINSQNNIIYIGKAKNLRNRIKSYFRSKKDMSVKNITMLKHIENFEWIVVSNEVEALLTEANLIKRHKPKYNIDLKDDKTYPFIKITNEPYPQIFITRKVLKDGAKYYGPFTDVNQLRKIMKMLSTVFPIRSCTYMINDLVIEQGKISLCLDYHINKCEGPCEGLVSNEHYMKMVERIKKFIKGQTQETELYIKDLMELASKKQKYELAGMYRDQLFAIQSFKQKQKLVSSKFDDRDVIALSKQGLIGIAVILRIRNGRIISREKLALKQLDSLDCINLSSIITRFYFNSDLIPLEISLQNKPINEKELKMWLTEKRKKKVKFIYPKRGEKAKELRVTYQNAKLLLGEWILKKQKRKNQVPKILEQLRNDLHLDKPIKRIEAFDISHLGGTNTVGSMVCFINTKPKKSEYRRFNVKSVDGIDDFSSIREIVYRRYKRVKDQSLILPDLILIDGGKGQLNMAQSALKDLNLDHIPIVGLAKRLEEIFIPGFKHAQSISKQSTGLILLRGIRDEAHRFAISFQRKKRKKSLVKSPFEDIQGMGEKRLGKLLRSFSGPDIISTLTPEVINGETGIPLKIAKEIILLAGRICKH